MAKELEIGEYAHEVPEGDDRRPDLVFLIGNVSLQRLIVVELKSANLPLNSEHHAQLKYYMARAKKWLKSHRYHLNVEGHLIGTMPGTESRSRGAVVLRDEIDSAGPNTPWKVRDYLEVLEDTRAAHDELLKVHRSVDRGD